MSFTHYARRSGAQARKITALELERVLGLDLITEFSGWSDHVSAPPLLRLFGDSGAAFLATNSLTPLPQGKCQNSKQNFSAEGCLIVLVLTQLFYKASLAWSVRIRDERLERLEELSNPSAG